MTGAVNVTQLTGSETVLIANEGALLAQTTTRAIANLAVSPVGNQWYVNETTGSDSNNGSAAAPFATLTAAQAAATANNGDVVYFYGTIHVTATVAWAKNGVSLVGLNPPSGNNRARISGSGSTVFTPMVKVTAEGCSFVNVGTFYGYANASAQVCWEDNGGRNIYQGCQFFGGGNATAAAQAGMRSLLISGVDGENFFIGCTIGLDTVTRATNANASLEFTNHTCRNAFYNCTFRALVSAAGDTHVTIGSGGIDRYALFNGCTFINAIDAGATAMTVGFLVNASAGGSVLLQDCTSLGATVYATTGPIYINGTVPTGATSGLAVAAT